MRGKKSRELRKYAQENATPVRKKFGGIRRHGWIVAPQYSGYGKRYMVVCLGLRRMYLDLKKAYKSTLDTTARTRSPLSSSDRLAMSGACIVMDGKYRETKGNAKRRRKIIERFTI
jgi:hypothetical protein